MKWVLRYFRGLKEVSLCFEWASLVLQGYVDADLADDVDNRKSKMGYIYTLGNTTISWVSPLQKIVAFSTTEAEYVAVIEASKVMIWLQGFLKELGKKCENSILYCDSQVLFI